MYGIFTYIWLIFRENVGKYSIHGAYGIYIPNKYKHGWLNHPKYTGIVMKTPQKKPENY